MSDRTSTARRYHRLSEHVTSFVDEPHDAVCCDVRGKTLNLVASESGDVRRASAELAGLPPQTTLRAIEKVPDLRLPARHLLFPELDIDTRYGTHASTRDPARFAFAHGGKDGIPFPVDRPTYDRRIGVLSRAVDRAKIDRSERIRALKRLAHFQVQ